MSQKLDLTKVAVISGRGNLPTVMTSLLRGEGIPFIKISVNSANAENDIIHTDTVENSKDNCEDNINYNISIGQIGKALGILRENQVREIVFAGYFDRPSNFFDLKLDMVGLKWVSKIAFKHLSDDKLLRYIIELFEAEGFKVISQKDILQLSDCMASKEQYTKQSPNDSVMLDISRGKEILNCLSNYDIAQSIIVENGMVLGIEAVEGTDELIKRVRNYPSHKMGCGVLVKLSKTSQDDRVDLPTVGLKTIEGMVKSGIGGLAIERGKTIFLDKEKAIKVADDNGIFIISI